MDTIEFSHLSKTPGYIECICIINGKEKKEFKIYFELDFEIIPSNDVIALALSTIAGQKFDRIKMDFDVSECIYNSIAKFTKADVVITKITNNEVRGSGKNIILNFSGGFDSLAAYYIMPDYTKLVAVDFGGSFQREAEFFKQFKPYTLKTNFRQLKLDRNSWTFMGVGAILYSEYLDAGYNVFGTIFEATPAHFKKASSTAHSNKTEPFYSAGLKDIRYTNGLTEVGTAIIVSYYAPELIQASLASLSMPKTEKRFRKELLLDIVCEKYNRKISVEKTLEPDTKIKFGTNLALDFLALYILKNRGIEAAKATMCDIPQEAVELAEECKLQFYERLNCDYVSGETFQTDDLRAEFMSKVLSAGVVPYTEKDYEELRRVLNYLNRYHMFEDIPCLNNKRGFWGKIFKDK